MNTLDWDNIYDSFDGTMPECTGKDCPESCCQTKKASTWGQGPVLFNTRFEDRDEYELFSQEESDGLFHTEFRDIGMDRSEFAYMVQNCIGEDGCNLSKKKPLQCRVFPFRFSKVRPLNARCPEAKAIALNLETREKIKSILSAFGLSENDLTQWEEQLEKDLQSL